jgi:hypothetical protein
MLLSTRFAEDTQASPANWTTPALSIHRSGIPDWSLGFIQDNQYYATEGAIPLLLRLLFSS